VLRSWCRYQTWYPRAGIGVRYWTEDPMVLRSMEEKSDITTRNMQCCGAETFVSAPAPTFKKFRLWLPLRFWSRLRQ
jgi:hypothetical protein